MDGIRQKRNEERAEYVLDLKNRSHKKSLLAALKGDPSTPRKPSFFQKAIANYSLKYDSEVRSDESASSVAFVHDEVAAGDAAQAKHEE